MGMFTTIPQDTFETLQVEAGVVLNSFNPSSPAAPASENIICATTGGITASCVAQYEDFGADIDNCPINVKELKRITGWDSKLGFTSLGTSAESIRLALGAADTSGGSYALTSDSAIVSGKTYYTRTGTSPDYTYTAVTSPSSGNLSSYYEKVSDNKIVPRRDLELSDFTDLWWVGDRADGGFVAVKLINALSTGGLSLKTTKAGKGQISVELTGHVSINDQETMPMEWYSMDPTE